MAFESIGMTTIRAGRKPAIIIARGDHDKLSRLAESRATHGSEAADELLAELDRARVVDDGRVAGNVVRMGSTVQYATESDETRAVTLVFPGEADITAGKVSVLTPIGAALIGLSVGQSIAWTARNGRVHRLIVESVDGPRLHSAETAPAQVGAE
jgi:regulator of nucleoside diphosphate kinase